MITIDNPWVYWAGRLRLFCVPNGSRFTPGDLLGRRFGNARCSTPLRTATVAWLRMCIPLQNMRHTHSARMPLAWRRRCTQLPNTRHMHSARVTLAWRHRYTQLPNTRHTRSARVTLAWRRRCTQLPNTRHTRNARATWQQPQSGKTLPKEEIWPSGGERPGNHCVRTPAWLVLENPGLLEHQRSCLKTKHNNLII